MTSEQHYLHPEAPRRRVSIATEAVDGRSGDHEEPHRRISVSTEFAEGRRKSILHTAGHQADPTSLQIPNHGDGEGRRKSILHNSNKGPDTLSIHSHYSHQSNHLQVPDKPANGEFGPRKKYSMTDSIYDKIKLPEPEPEKPWWFILCKKCHQDDSGLPSWEPPLWQRLCPAPFCPTYRQFARVFSLFLIVMLSWGIIFSVFGNTAAPGGQLFTLAILSISANIGGWLISFLNMPALVGMLMVGIIFQNVGLIHIEGPYMEMVSILRRIALVIILIRAGLDLDPPAFKKLYGTVLKLGLIPWIIECVVVAIMAHFLLDFTWMWGLLLGSIIAAVSPAVIVSCLFRLRKKGYGVAKGIPTLIIAVSGIDDASSVAIFGIIHSLMFSHDSLVYQILQGPISIFGGIGFGILWGILLNYVPEKNDPYVVPLRILMLLGGGLIAVFGSESVGLGGAGPLGCVAAGFVSLIFWSRQGWEVEDNPVATAFEIFWMIFEPILFGLTGTQIKMSELELNTVSIMLAVLFTGIILRIIGTVLLAVRSQLNLKEKIFVALSWMAKATVQAALGPVALDSVRELNDPVQKRYAEVVLMICVLSILLTAPTGAILITLSGSRLLKKTTAPPIIEGWRRSARPSLRDITIIDEEEDGEGVAT